MKYISHRGNLNKRIEKLENHPEYIHEALSKNYDVEIDLWVINRTIFLGHDYNQFEISDNFLIKNHKKLWIHAKNDQALFYLNNNKKKFNYFWHQNDEFTITSSGHIWTHFSSNKKYLKKNNFVNKKMILTLPELIDKKYEKIVFYNQYYAVCSDLIENYKMKIEKND